MRTQALIAQQQLIMGKQGHILTIQEHILQAVLRVPLPDLRERADQPTQTLVCQAIALLLGEQPLQTGKALRLISLRIPHAAWLVFRK